MMRFWISDSYLYPWGRRRALWLADRFSHVTRHYPDGMTPTRQPFDKALPRSSIGNSSKYSKIHHLNHGNVNCLFKIAITVTFHLNKQVLRRHGISSQQEIVIYKETQNWKVHQNMKFQIKSITVEIKLYFSYFSEIFRWVLVQTEKEMWKSR